MKKGEVMRCPGRCGGPVKPEIVFFGEGLPKKFFEAWKKIKNQADGVEGPLFEDGGCDLRIIIGTALAVPPFSNTINQADKECPKVLINLENTKTTEE